MDLDGDGLISKDELRAAAANIGEKISEEQLDAMFREADSDGSGQVDYEKFKKFVAS